MAPAPGAGSAQLPAVPVPPPGNAEGSALGPGRGEGLLCCILCAKAWEQRELEWSVAEAGACAVHHPCAEASAETRQSGHLFLVLPAR